MSTEELLLIAVSVGVVILILVVTVLLITLLIVLKKIKKTTEQVHEISVVSKQAAERYAPILGLLQFIKYTKQRTRR